MKRKKNTGGYHSINGLDAQSHSPAKNTEAFNPKFLGDGRVPRESLKTGNPGPAPSIPANPSSYKAGTQQNDPMANTRGEYQCFEAKAPTAVPTGKPMGKQQGGDRRDAGGVTSYADGRV